MLSKDEEGLSLIAGITRHWDKADELLDRLKVWIRNYYHTGLPPPVVPSLPFPVQTLSIAWLPGGAAAVKLDSGKPFRLPPVPAALLAVLTSECGEQPGRIARWIPRPEARRRLAARLGRAGYTRGAFNTAVYRLRKALARRDYPRDLVHTDEGLDAICFLLVRQSADVAA